MKHRALDFFWNWHADYCERGRQGYRANAIYVAFLSWKIGILNIFNLQQNKSFILNNKVSLADDIVQFASCSMENP